MLGTAHSGAWLPLVAIVDWALVIACMPIPGRSSVIRMSSASYIAAATLLTVVIALLAWPEGPGALRVLLGIGIALLSCLGARKWGTEAREIQREFKRLHDPIRSKLKARTNKIGRELYSAASMTAFFLAQSEIDHQRWHEAWYNADVALAATYQRDLGEIQRILRDLPACDIEPPEDIQRLVKDCFLKTAGITSVADYLLNAGDSL